jgi:ABC-type molybdate transport system permease subunit
MNVLEWLGGVGATAFRWSALAFVILNGAAIAAVILTRDRSLVNRWTGRLLAANLLLAGTGIGIPLLTTVTRLAMAMVIPDARRQLTPRATVGEEMELQPIERAR